RAPSRREGQAWRGKGQSRSGCASEFLQNFGLTLFGRGQFRKWRTTSSPPTVRIPVKASHQSPPCSFDGSLLDAAAIPAAVNVAADLALHRAAVAVKAVDSAVPVPI